MERSKIYPTVAAVVGGITSAYMYGEGNEKAAAFMAFAAGIAAMNVLREEPVPVVTEQNPEVTTGTGQVQDAATGDTVELTPEQLKDWQNSSNQ